jgi:hypothetical protein
MEIIGSQFNATVRMVSEAHSPSRASRGRLDQTNGQDQPAAIKLIIVLFCPSQYSLLVGHHLNLDLFGF